MAIRLEIDNGDYRGYVDYTRHLTSPDHSPMVLRERLNTPALLDFSLAPSESSFVLPSRSARVRLTGLAEALPPGGPRLPGVLFSGIITSEPLIEYAGIREGAPVHFFRLQATSEEYLLNVKRIGPLPPFLNQPAGEILRALAGHLQPGRFDTSEIAAGPVVPVFHADPEATWSEIARELAERSGYACRVLDGKIRFQPLDDADLGIRADATDRRYRPDALDVTPTGNPIRNDVTIFGEMEPQTFVAEYFVGDGFTARFPLAQPVYGAASALLLQDDFIAAALDTTKWSLTDPLGAVSLSGGRLNVSGGTGNANETWLAATQILELGGEIELIHGEFEFSAVSTGVLGGLFPAATPAAAACLAGFDVSPSTGTTRIRARVNGAVEAPEVLVQSGEQYVLVTRLSADQPHRTALTFPSGSGSFGGAALPGNVRVHLEVRVLPLATPGVTTTTVLHESTQSAWPEYAYYAPLLAADLHIAASFLQVTRPIQAVLETTPPGGTAQPRTLGFGIAGQDATITSDPNLNQWALEFYADTIPARGERIHLRYRAAGRARARLRDAASVAAEAALAGDDGVRAAVLKEAQPAPRTSQEAELAARAYLADHVAPRYEGTYVTWSALADGFPRCGRFLEVNDPARYPAFRALVRGVTSEFRELAGEHILHTIEFGQPSRFETLLHAFTPRDAVLGEGEDRAIAPEDAAITASRFLPDVTQHAMTVFVPQFYFVDMGADPPAGGSYEVRRSDAGWSAPGQPGSSLNFLSSAAGRTFVLPRTARNQLFFIRPVDATGTTSRFSSLLAVRYPLRPAQPAALLVTHETDTQQRPMVRAVVELSEAGIQDVDRVELRDEDDTTVLARWDFAQLRYEAGTYRAELLLDNSVALLRSRTFHAYAQNLLGEFSAKRSATGVKNEPTKPYLNAGNSRGALLEILLDRGPAGILETEIQVAGPDTTFAAPTQSVILDGQPQKFSVAADQVGGWSFRARRRDALGWSPWSTEPQGQLSGQLIIIFVQYLNAPELDPSIGAAINPQNLLPNSDFFLGGISGQEGIYAPRYFALVNAASDGSELAWLAATHELQWKSGVAFSAANPGVRGAIGNFGRLFNPGEPLTLSAALRAAGTAAFPRGVRLALRSPGTPAFSLSVDVPSGRIGQSYQWYSATFALPASGALPDDLSVEISIVASAGDSLADALYCDKLVLHRGHRPAAFGHALWDIAPLAWNASQSFYELPATAVAASPRSTDPGQAGLLLGTGTEDLDPDFASRYSRFVA